MEKTVRFLPYFFTAFMLLVIYCFSPGYFSHIPDFKNMVNAAVITNFTHFHAFMLVTWLLMLIAQPILIVRKQIKWHRLLGKASYFIVALMLISFLLVIRQEQLREKSLEMLAAQMFDLPMFLIFYGLAIYHRKNPAYHSRFIIMSVLPFLNPALARVHVAGVPVQLVVWAALFAIEFFNRKTYKPYLIGLGFYVLNLAFIAYLLLANKTLLDKIWHFFFG